MANSAYTPPTASVTPTNTVTFTNKDLTDPSNTMPAPVLGGARATQSAGQSITSTYTAVTFDVEAYDTDSYHNNVTNNTRFTVPSTGRYLLTANAPTAGNTAHRAKFRIDGTTDLALSGGGNAGASTDNGPSISTVINLTAGQYVEFMVGYVSATSTTISGVGGTSFTITKLS